MWLLDREAGPAGRKTLALLYFTAGPCAGLNFSAPTLQKENKNEWDVKPSYVEAHDNQGIGEREPGWAFGLANEFRNCGWEQAEHLALAKFEPLWGERGPSKKLEFKALACRKFSFCMSFENDQMKHKFNILLDLSVRCDCKHYGVL